jgi:mannose/cellobiose epimerase-like protein (N-acyl-D-glucosamine 2-epimerase family)
MRLSRIFLPDANGHRPCHAGDERYAKDLHYRDLVLFHEYFHGDNGRGVGASHQTGWTSLVVRLIENLGQKRASEEMGEAMKAAMAHAAAMSSNGAPTGARG